MTYGWLFLTHMTLIVIWDHTHLRLKPAVTQREAQTRIRGHFLRCGINHYQRHVQTKRSPESKFVFDPNHLINLL